MSAIDSLPVPPEWSTDSFTRLKATLQSALSHAHASGVGAEAAFAFTRATDVRDALITHARGLTTALLGVPGKDKQTRDELLKSGTILLSDSLPFRCNPPLIQSILPLSDLLCCHESIAATLIRAAIDNQGRLGGRSLLDTAVILWHAERAHAIECLELIVRGAYAAEFRGTAVRKATRKFAVEVLGLPDIAERSDATDDDDDLAVPSATAPSTFSVAGSSETSTFSLPAHLLSLIPTLQSSINAASTFQPQPAQPLLASASAFVSTTAPPIPPISVETTTLHGSYLTVELKRVSSLLTSLSLSNALTLPSLLATLRHLKTCTGEDPSYPSLFAAVFAGLRTTPGMHELSNTAAIVEAAVREAPLFVREPELLKQVWVELEKKQEWKWDGLRAGLGLVWIVAARVAAGPPALPLHTHTSDHLTFLTNKTTPFVDAGGLSFLRLNLLSFRPWHWSCDGVLDPPAPSPPLSAPPVRVNDEKDVDTDTRAVILSLVDDWTVGFIARAGTAIHKARQVEEDPAGPAPTHVDARGGSRFGSGLGSLRASNPSAAPASASASASAPRTPRADFSSLLLLIHTLHRGRPDSAAAFWRHPSCAGFLSHARDTTGAGARAALFVALAALSEGAVCAGWGHGYLSDSDARSFGFGSGGGMGGGGGGAHQLVSWRALANGIDYSVEYLRPANEGGKGTGYEMPRAEVRVLCAFLHLLRTVAGWHAPARAALAGYVDPRWRMADRCVALAVSPAPGVVKAAAMGAAAGLARGYGEGAAEGVWRALEATGVVSDIRTDLEREAHEGTCAVTLAVVDLVGVLVRATANGSGVQGVWETLGVGKRVPGVGPYVKLVCEVMVKARRRPYADPADMWRLLYACTRFLEACLDALDLRDVVAARELASKSLVAPESAPQLGGFPGPALSDMALAAIQSAMYNPGFTIMVALLSGHRILDELCEIVATSPVPGWMGVEAVDAGTAGGVPPDYAPAVLRSMRVIWRALQIEEVFLRHVVPAVRDAVAARTAGGAAPGFAPPVRVPANLLTLPQLLLIRRAVVPRMAAYINSATSRELGWIAVKILDYLATTHVFGGIGSDAVGIGGAEPRMVGAVGIRGNVLVQLLQTSEEANAVIAGVADRLAVAQVDGEEDVIEDERQVGEEGGGLFQPEEHGGASGRDEALVESVEFVDSLEQVKREANEVCLSKTLRRAILDILLRNLADRRVYPSLAHFLLGFDTSQNARRLALGPDDSPSCLHVILDLLSMGTASKQGDVGDVNALTDTEPLWMNHPSLAERCYHLLYVLCAEKATSEATMRYLRSIGFVGSQLPLLDVELPSLSNRRPGIRQRLHGAPHATDDTAEDVLVATRRLDDKWGVLSMVHSKAWLLKLAVLEVHSLSLKGLRSDAEHLVKGFFGKSTANETATLKNGMQFFMENPTTTNNDSTSNLIVILLDSLDLSFSQPDPPARLAGADLARFLKMNDRGCYVYDLASVHAYLNAEKRQAETQGVMLGQQRDDLQEQIRAILYDVLRNNFVREDFFARCQILAAWRELVEVIVAPGILDSLDRQAKEDILVDISELIVRKLEDPGSEAKMTSSLSATLVVVVSRLGESGRLDKGTTASEHVFGQPKARVPADIVVTMSEQLIRCLENRESTSSEFRGNLYTALVYLLVTNREAELGDGARRLMGGRNALRIIMDDCDSPENWSLTAINLLEVLSSRKGSSSDVLRALSRSNYLRNFLHFVKSNDQAICTLLRSEDIDGKSLAPLFAYYQVMTLLLRLTTIPGGPAKLLEANLCEIFSEIQFVDHRVAFGAISGDSVTNIDLHHNLVMPMFRILNGVLAAKAENRHFAEKCSLFVQRHIELFSSILRDARPTVTMSSLAELDEVTRFLSNLSSNRELFGAQVPGQGRLGGLVLGDLILGLLSKYAESVRWISAFTPADEEDTERERKSAQFLADKVVLNCLTFSRRVVAEMARDDFFMPLFSFALDETRVGFAGYGDIGPSRPSTPSLATLLTVVRSANTRLKALSVEHRHLHSREAEFEGGRSFDGLEIKEIANEITDIGRIILDPTSSMQSRQTAAFSGLKSMISLRVRWLNESLYTLEQALYLVLRHLVYYFEEYKPSFDNELSSSLVNTLLWPPQPTSLLYSSGGHATNPTKSDLERVIGELVRPTAYVQSSLTVVLEELSVEETLSHVSDLRFKQSLVGNNTLAIEAVVSRAAKRFLSDVHY